MTSECVKVIVRCRPMNEREHKLKCKFVIEMVESRGQCIIKNPNDLKAPPKTFTFDGGYFINSSTEQIYNDIAYPLVEVCISPLSIILILLHHYTSICIHSALQMPIFF